VAASKGKAAGDDVEAGRPAHEWDKTIADRVSALAERGVKQIKIAAAVELSINTLRRYYSKELLLADAKVQEAIGAAQLSIALGRPARFDENNNQTQSELLPNPTMLIFLGKARLGQRETSVHENINYPPGGDENSIAGLTESERLARLAALSDRARARRARRPANGKRAVGSTARPAKKSPKQ
jgi:hypothetical protein